MVVEGVVRTPFPEGRLLMRNERISKAHRKLSESDEQRVVSEYESGKTAAQISAESWCGLSREGVNYLLRRRGIKTHALSRWDGKIEQICNDFH